MQRLFMDSPDDQLSRHIVRNFYEIKWSVEGSNRKLLEEDTVFCFEAFLEYCEDETWSLVVVVLVIIIIILIITEHL